ncbi:hypothetical protein IQ07DRAFT_529607 [Pyrenochaeta sp. DS3sAY3a]|nr:hypothetical protein IQ07DRAFT_529607 [Pyrenochaeta sp. DS3sAY3a]
MADGAPPIPLPGIMALKATTAQQISSGQLLVDPSSVVKELIENALDARAKSIFIDISANALESIQVKDDGHGIPAEDRALACRRYCTSKIRDYDDLKEVGGKWLGFRGEALASIAEMSDSLSITSRVEGEPVAVRLKYGRNGELTSSEKDSHPVGTTVKVTGFFKHLPVRQQTALQNSTKFLAKIRKLVQAYSLARPHVRLRFHVLKAKSGNYDLIYAPKADASVEDAVVKVISKDCASQCDSITLEKNGFLIRAFLPKSTANGSKISTHGAFISIDARPVANNRGLTKQIVKNFVDALRKSNHSLATVKMPFMYMNIACPPGSYDANIEPAKDDVIFDESSLLIEAVEELLDTFYTTVIMDMETTQSSPPVNRSRIDDAAVILSATEARVLSRNEVPVRASDLSTSEVQHSPSRWASTMYGISIEDGKFAEEGNIAIVEEEEDLRSAEASNPWTIAKMNAPAKPRKAPLNMQRPSPTKNQSDKPNERSSSVFESPARQTLPYAPLTPQSSPTKSLPIPSGHSEPVTNARRLETRPAVYHSSQNPVPPVFEVFPYPASEPGEAISSVPPSPHRETEKQRGYINKPFVPPLQRNDETRTSHIQALNTFTFSQPPQKKQRNRRPKDAQHLPENSLPPLMHEPAPAGQVTLRAPQPDDVDIRSYFGRDKRQADDVLEHPTGGFQFTPINSQSTSSQLRSRPRPLHIPTKPQGMTSPPHNRPESRPRRLRSDKLERTKSSRLPLERVPAGYRIHDVVLQTTTSIVAILRASRGLDMQRNGLRWGTSVQEATSVFTEAAHESRIRTWVLRLDQMLDQRWQRVDGVDTRGALHESMQVGLDGKKATGVVDDVHVNVLELPGVRVSAVPDAIHNNLEEDGVQDANKAQKLIDIGKQGEEYGMVDFDMAQFVDFDAEEEMEAVGALKDQKRNESDECYDDIDDDMLMDL